MDKKETYTANGRHIERGTEVTIAGHGRMRFLAHVTHNGKEWIDLVDKYKAIRSFRPTQIKRVHYKTKMRRP